MLRKMMFNNQAATRMKRAVSCLPRWRHSLPKSHQTSAIVGHRFGINTWTVERMQTFKTCHARVLSTMTKAPVVYTVNNNHHCNSDHCRTFTENRKTTALTLIKDLKHLRSSPVPALVLGVAGVIPFAVAPAYIILSGSFAPSIAFSQVAYGACILSFLGGVRWGLSVSSDEAVRPDWFNLSYSVTPSLIAWVGLMLPTSASILVMITGLLGACFMDVTLWGYPPWFKALRFLLTFMAVLSLWTTLMCRLLMGAEKKSEKKVVQKVEDAKEKRSWFRLPWKTSKPKQVIEPPATEAKAEPVVYMSAKTEEKPPVVVSELTGDSESTEETVGVGAEKQTEKKELKW